MMGFPSFTSSLSESTEDDCALGSAMDDGDAAEDDRDAVKDDRDASEGDREAAEFARHSPESTETKVIDGENDRSFSWIAILPVTTYCLDGRMRWHTNSRGVLSDCEKKTPACIISFGGEFWVPYFSIAAEIADYDSERGLAHCVAIHLHEEGLVCTFARREPKSQFMALAHVLGTLSLCQRQGRKQLCRINRSPLAYEARDFPSIQFLKEASNTMGLTYAGFAICPGIDKTVLEMTRMAGYIFGMFSDLKFHAFKHDRAMVQSFRSISSFYCSGKGTALASWSSWATFQDIARSQHFLRRIEPFLQAGESLHRTLEICGCELNSDGEIELSLGNVSRSQSQKDEKHESSANQRSLDDGTRSLSAVGVERIRPPRKAFTVDRCFSPLEKIQEEDCSEEDCSEEEGL